MSAQDIAQLIGHLNAQQGQSRREENRLRQREDVERLNRQIEADNQAARDRDDEFRNRKYVPLGGWVDPNIALDSQRKISQKIGYMKRIANELNLATLHFSDISSEQAATFELLCSVLRSIRENYPNESSRVSVNRSLTNVRYNELYRKESERLIPIFKRNYDYAIKRRRVLWPHPLVGRPYRVGSIFKNWNPTKEKLDEIIKFSPEPPGYDPDTSYFPPRAKDFKPSAILIPAPAKVRKKIA